MCYTDVAMKSNDKKAALAELKRLYPDARPALVYSSAYELLVAVILSAQCTDIRVNQVTEKLFENHSTPAAMLELTQEELEKYIFSCGLYKTKAGTPSPWIRTFSASATVWDWQRGKRLRKWRRDCIRRCRKPIGRRRITG